jgi:hypothetical protein
MLFDELLAGASPEHRIVHVAPESPAQIVYTSGTTSRPKGAVISHRSSIIQGIANAMLFGMTAVERTCVVLPLFHVNGQYVGVVPTLTVGGTIVLLEAFSARKFWGQVRAHRCTFMSIVPMLLRTMLAQPPRADDGEHSCACRSMRCRPRTPSGTSSNTASVSAWWKAVFRRPSAYAPPTPSCTARPSDTASPARARAADARGGRITSRPAAGRGRPDPRARRADVFRLPQRRGGDRSVHD